MSGKTHTLFKHLGLALMMCIMATMLVNNSAYIHVHVLSDGSLATHAHPFDRSDEGKQGNSHQHSSLEIQLFNDLQLLFSVCLLALALIHFTRKTRIIPVQQLLAAYACAPALPGRAPPCI